MRLSKLPIDVNVAARAMECWAVGSSCASRGSVRASLAAGMIVGFYRQGPTRFLCSRVDHTPTRFEMLNPRGQLGNAVPAHIELFQFWKCREFWWNL